jgi:rod shape-determining protein MreC
MALAIDAHKRRFLLVGLVLVHLAVISHQVDAGGGVSVLQRAVFNLLSPLQSALAAVVRSVSSAWHGWVDLRHVHQTNERLDERVRYLETLLQEQQHDASDAGRLRELLTLRQALPLQTIAAEVVTRDGIPWCRTLTIDRGRDAGVALQAAVLSPTGVLGRVVAIGSRAAKVQLLQDRESGAGAMIERSRVAGVVSGQVGFADAGTSDLVMKYVPALADIVVGDLVVTSGMDRIYPKGLVVGRVRVVNAGSGLFKEILVVPSARPDETDQVLVVKTTEPPPQFDEAVK